MYYIHHQQLYKTNKSITITNWQTMFPMNHNINYEKIKIKKNI